MPSTEKAAPDEICRGVGRDAMLPSDDPGLELPQFLIHYNTGYQREEFPLYGGNRELYSKAALLRGLFNLDGKPMNLIRNNPVAMYLQIADRLRAEITEGTYEPSGRLPSESQIMARFNVSRVTVRLALEQVDKDGLIERRKGKGTFVAGKQVRHQIDTLRSFHESLKVQGFDATMRIIELSALETPSAFIPLFGTQCTLLERLHVVNDEPIAVGRSLLPAFMSDLQREFAEQQPTYALLKDRAGANIVSAEIAIGARAVSSRITSPIGAAANAVLLVLERTSYFDNGACAERSEFFIRPERYKFVLGNRIPER
ncbi:GntR family transcriptional regulator [Rhizobium sp. BR 362]|uniref:GntR family transcriptional regulator n=1 Tax=Rhizobium sp. BR 362 TaxID=3040670 RepID=UPI002F416764